jgi:hypothetical protein
MIQEKLKDYIKSSIASGKTIDEIKATLAKAGWKESDISDTYYELKSNFSPAEKSTCGLAIVGLVLSFIFPLIGLIVSIVALSQINKDPGLKGKELALIGIVVGLMGMLIIIPIVLITVLGIGIGFAKSVVRSPGETLVSSGEYIENQRIQVQKENTVLSSLNEYKISMSQADREELYLTIRNDVDADYFDLVTYLPAGAKDITSGNYMDCPSIDVERLVHIPAGSIEATKVQLASKSNHVENCRYEIEIYYSDIDGNLNFYNNEVFYVSVS